MDRINFLFFRSDMQAQGEEGNALIMKFLQKSGRIIEQEVNEAGGIAGKPIKINWLRVNSVKHPGDNERDDYILKALDNQSDTLFFYSSTTRLAEKADPDSYICFGGVSEHPNVFSVSRASQQTKVNGAIQIIKNHPEKSKVIFIHDGKRTAKYIEQFKEELGSKFNDYNFVEFKEEPEIRSELENLFSQIDESCILILDVGLRVFKHIFYHLNETGKQPQVLKFFGNIGGRFDSIGFPLISFGTELSFMSLDFEDLIRETEMDLNTIEREWVRVASYFLEYPLLTAYAGRQSSVTYETRDQFLRDMSAAIKRIDGKRDLFVGKRLSYAFAENKNIIKNNFTYQYPASLQSDGNYPVMFYREQFPAENEGQRPIPTNYIYIDILRVNNIHVGEGTWSAEFNLDIISPHEDPIEIIKFNNLSAIKPKFECKLIWESEANENGLTTRRYYVVANFDFISVADNYPFDWQHIFISYALVNPEKHGAIQPIPEALLDREFKIDGWILKESITGVLQKKQTIYEGDQLDPKTTLALEPRVGWTLARANSATLMKLGVPLSFLLFLVYYTLFKPYGGFGGSMGVLTTAFLSGIALYFSAERPAPLRMTTIDLVFVGYYVLTGSIIVATALSSALGETIYNPTMEAFKYLLPASIAGFGAYIWRRINSNRSKPRINKTD